jgi:hypothetical protein
MPITPLPTPPSRADSANFASRADSFLAALPAFATETNATASEVNSKEASALSSANIATTKASEALASANFAESKSLEAQSWAIGESTPGGSAKFWATSLLNIQEMGATSTSSILIGAGSKSFSLLQLNKAFIVGQYVQVVSSSSPQNWMIGAITSFNSGTGAITINSFAFGGSGTFSSWTVVLSNPPELPSQSGNAGKSLVTNGSSVSWQFSSDNLPLFISGII